jgi:hypothetical protein
MRIELTHPNEHLRGYISGVVALAAEELGIPMPEVCFYRDWNYVADVWMEKDGIERIHGFAQPYHHRIALRDAMNLDQLLHVALHEVRHLVTFGREEYEGAAGEIDACTWADNFQARRFTEIYDLLNRSNVSHDQYMGHRDHDCAGCAMAAEERVYAQ